MLHSECDLTGAEITFGLDNNEAHKAVVAEEHPSVKKPDYDRIHNTHQQMTQLPTTFHSKWMKSHQDWKNKDATAMDILTLLNIQMDQQAGEHREHKSNTKMWKFKAFHSKMKR